MRLRSILIVSLLQLAQMPAWAQRTPGVALTGIMGQRALVVINGAPPEIIAPGESRDGVTLISVAGDQAVVEIEGRRQNLRVGEVPVRLGGKTGTAIGTRIVLTAGPGGHFITQGQINGVSVRFLVDTGASEVSMSALEADRIGLQYRSGTPILLNTANGAVQGYQIHLDAVRLGDVEIYNVESIVTASQMPFVLLGNSFLTHFQMTRENDSLLLDKRF
jgi:aspartyl protease family protein